MARWEVNKGVGRTVKLKGLEAQYLFLFTGGLLAVFFLMVMLYLCGIDQVVCLSLGLVGAAPVVWQTSVTNRKYGRCGLMKQGAIKMYPHYLLNRRTVLHLIRNLKPKRKA